MPDTRSGQCGASSIGPNSPQFTEWSTGLTYGVSLYGEHRLSPSSAYSRANFKPAWWLRSTHLQTLWGTLFHRLPQIALRREKFELPDGDFIDLDWGPNESGPIVVILHGLEGNSHSHYVSGLLAELQKRGWRSVVMHFRGCGGQPNRLPRSYHSGDTGDFRELIKALKFRDPGIPISAVGFSLGGNALLKYLGECPGRALLDSAVAVCVPMVLGECAARLDRGFSKIYQWWLLYSLKRKIREKSTLTPLPIDLYKLWACHTFREFDDLVTAPLHGFHNAQDYYRQVSARQFLASITTPTLIIHAQDDHFMSANVLATPDELSPEVSVEIALGGGHIGFIEGAIPMRAKYWLYRRIVDALKQLPHSTRYECC